MMAVMLGHSALGCGVLKLANPERAYRKEGMTSAELTNGRIECILLTEI